MRGKEIKELRLKIGLTQKEFADKLGVTVTTVSGWERDKREPGPLAGRALMNLKFEMGIDGKI